eukprot:997287-Amphidinium_carterae.2
MAHRDEPTSAFADCGIFDSEGRGVMDFAVFHPFWYSLHDASAATSCIDLLAADDTFDLHQHDHTWNCIVAALCMHRHDMAQESTHFSEHITTQTPFHPAGPRTMHRGVHIWPTMHIGAQQAASVSRPGAKRGTPQHSKSDEVEIVPRTLKFLTYNARSLNGTAPEGDVEMPSYGLNHTGLLLKFVKDLAERHIDIAAVQETRLKLTDPETNIAGYHIITQPAAEGRGSHGGLMIAVRESHDVRIVSHRFHGKRVLAVVCRIGHKTLLLASMHAPMRKAPQVDHDDFRQHVRTMLECRNSSHEILIGCDLNGRVGSYDDVFEGIGSYTSPCPHEGKHIRPLVHCLNRQGLCFLNTLMPPVGTDHTTWQHPRSAPDAPRLFQIDFILASRTLRHTCSMTSPMAWGELDAMHEADHRPITSHFTISGMYKKKQSAKIRSCLTPAHEELFRRTLRERLLQHAPDRQLTPAQRIQYIQELAMEVMYETRPTARTPKKAWITDTTWRAMMTVSTVRRIIARWRHRRIDTAAMILAIKIEAGVDEHLEHLADTSTERLINEALRAHLKSQVKKLRYALRWDKKRYFEDRCTEAAEHFSARKSKEAFAAVKRLVLKSSRRDGAALKIGDDIVHDPEIVADAWLQHWQQHFSASANDQHHFTEIEIPSADHEEQAALHCLSFTLPEVRNNFKAMAKHRASPDLLHFRYWDSIIDHVQDDLLLHFNDIARAGRCPKAFKGAEIVPIRKKNKCQEMTTSYRPIMLMLSTAKLFSRLCMQKLAQALARTDAMPRTQHAMGPAAGVELPHLAMTQCMALAASLKHSVAIVYLDIRSAFDAVLRQLLVPLDDEHGSAATSLHTATNRPLDDCARMVEYVRSQPMSLIANDLPAGLVKLLQPSGLDYGYMV